MNSLSVAMSYLLTSITATNKNIKKNARVLLRFDFIQSGSRLIFASLEAILDGHVASDRRYKVGVPMETLMY